MSVCEHDPYCSGAGWAHDAQLTEQQRTELGITPGEHSMRKATRQMRKHRRTMRIQAEYEARIIPRVVGPIEGFEE